MMQRNLFVFVVSFIALLSVVSNAANVVESATKHVYNDNLPQGLSRLSLAGVGVRVKQIGPIAAKVYSTGIYVDKAAVLSKCKHLNCKNEKELANSKGFGDAFVESPSSKSIVLRMARTVGAETMVNAVAESVRPRMKGKDLPALDKFQSVLLDGLKNGGAKTNMVFRFENSGNSKLTIVIDGNKRGTITSPTLCKAFTSVYMGPGGVSPSLKENCAKTVLSWK